MRLAFRLDCDSQELIAISLDDLIRLRQHVRRNRETNLLCCSHIDDELEFRRLLYGQVSGLPSFQDLIYIGCGTPEHGWIVGRVRHEAPRIHELTVRIYRRKAPSGSKVNDLCLMSEQELVSDDEEATRPLPGDRCEWGFEFLGRFHFSGFELQAQGFRGRLRLTPAACRNWIGRIQENGHAG